MDAAKAMWLFYEYPDTDFNNLKQNSWISASGSINIEARTESEVRCHSNNVGNGLGSNFVCRHHGQRAGNTKYPLADYELTPDVAIIDPEFVYSCLKRR